MEGFYGHIVSTHRLELRHVVTQNYEVVKCLRRIGSRFGEHLASLCPLILLGEI